MDSEHAQILPLGNRRLLPGVEYRVMVDFHDDAGALHTAGERWLFLGFEAPRLYPGYILHVRDECGRERSFRLKWGDERQREVTNSFERYVVGPIIETEVLLNDASAGVRATVRRACAWLHKPLPKTSEGLLEMLHTAASHAQIAYDKGAEDQLALSTDLEHAATELEHWLRKYRA
jgi:hypothetical protein